MAERSRREADLGAVETRKRRLVVAIARGDAQESLLAQLIVVRHGKLQQTESKGIQIELLRGSPNSAYF